MPPALLIGEPDPSYRTIWTAAFADVTGIAVEQLTDRQLLADARVDAVVLAGQIIETQARLRDTAAGELYDDAYPEPGSVHILYGRRLPEMVPGHPAPWIVVPPMYRTRDHERRQATLSLSEQAADEFRHILERIVAFNAGPWQPKIHRLGFNPRYFWGRRDEHTTEAVAQALRVVYDNHAARVGHT